MSPLEYESHVKITSVQQGYPGVIRHQGNTVNISGSDVKTVLKDNINVSREEIIKYFPAMYLNDQFNHIRSFNLEAVRDANAVILKPIIDSRMYSWSYGTSVKDVLSWPMSWRGWPSRKWRVYDFHIGGWTTGIGVVQASKLPYTGNYYLTTDPVPTSVTFPKYRLLVKDRCILQCHKLLHLNEPVMIGFERHTAAEYVGLGKQELTGGSRTLNDPGLIASIRIYALEWMLPLAWQGGDHTRRFILDIYKDEVRVFSCTGGTGYVDAATDPISLGGYFAPHATDDAKLLISFPSKLNFTLADKPYLESFYIGLIPLATSVIIVWIVNGEAEYHTIRWPKEEDVMEGYYISPDWPSDADNCSKWIGGKNRYVETFYKPMDVPAGPAQNEYMPKNTMYTNYVPVIWEENSSIEVLVNHNPMYVKVCPLLFASEGYINTDVSNLGYYPDIRLMNDRTFHFVGRNQVIAGGEYNDPNPHIDATVYLQKTLRDGSVDSYKSINWKPTYRHYFDEATAGDPYKHYKTFRYQAGIRLFGEVYPAPPGPNYPSEHDRIMIHEDLGLSFTGEEVELLHDSGYSHYTPALMGMEVKYEPENLALGYEDGAKYLDTDIVQIRKVENWNYGSVNIGKLYMSLVCYDQSHMFLKSGITIKVSTYVGDHDFDQDLGYYKIKRVERSFDEPGIVKINIECNNLLDLLETTKVINCEVYDGLGHRKTMRRLLKLADLTMCTDAEMEILFPDLDSESPFFGRDTSLPYSLDSSGSAWRTTRGMSVLSMVNNILQFSGWNLVLIDYGDYINKVAYIPNFTKNEVLDEMVLSESPDSLREIHGMDYNSITGEYSNIVSWARDDKKLTYYFRWPGTDHWVPVLPVANITEIEDDELATRIYVGGPDPHHERDETKASSDVDLVTSGLFEPIVSSLIKTPGMLWSQRWNVELEKELGASRITVFTERRLLNAEVRDQIATDLAKQLGKRRKTYRLTMTDMSAGMGIRLLHKVRVHTRTQKFLALDTQNKDVYEDQIYDYPAQLKIFESLLVAGFDLVITKFSRSGSIFLREFLPTIGLGE